MSYLRRRIAYARRRGPFRRAVLGELPFPGLDWLFALADCCWVFDLYELAISPWTRGLTEAEFRLLVPIFGKSVPWDIIRIDERAWLGPRYGNFCYVSLHTVNSWGKMSAPTLVHEIVHVWQYTHRGAAYIPRALAAQRSEMGYNYGGLPGLRAAHCLEDFNYEQMADVIEDAYRLANGYQAQWLPGGAGPTLLYHFQPFLTELLEAQELK